MAQKIIQMQMRHLYFNLKDLFSNRKGFVILTSLLRFKNKSREFREYTVNLTVINCKKLTVYGRFYSNWWADLMPVFYGKFYDIFLQCTYVKKKNCVPTVHMNTRFHMPKRH